ncbi:hypothetical protein ACFQU5_12300 [Ureibacillus sp. GCM10028918]
MAGELIATSTLVGDAQSLAIGGGIHLRPLLYALQQIQKRG